VIKPLRLSFAVPVVLAGLGCTVSREGTLLLVPDGPTIPLEVTVTSEEVVLEGVNPATGERLHGSLEKVGGEAGTGEPWIGGSPNAPASPGAAGIDSTSATELRMNVAGTLSGDLGTRMRCVAEVERRLYLRGGGSCIAEGGASYRLKF